MQIPTTSASPLVKPLKPWINNDPAAKPAPISKPKPKPIDSHPVKPLYVGSTKPLATGPKAPSATPAATISQFKGPALQTSGLENNALTVANPKPDPQTLSLEGLAKAWGTGDSNYDFTGDGVVNVHDLLYMMDNWELIRPSNTLTHAPEGELVTADQPVLATAPAGMEAMGGLPSKGETSIVADSSAAVDMPLEIDTVDVKPDVEIALATAEETGAEPSVKPEENLEPGATAVPSSETPAPSTGESLNLRAYVDSLRADDSRRATVGGLNGAAARAAIAPEDVRGTATRSVGGLKPLADSVFDHLASAGFVDQPPTNIRELVDALNLSPRQTDFMLKQLMMKYPQGLGVNMIG